MSVKTNDLCPDFKILVGKNYNYPLPNQEVLDDFYLQYENHLEEIEDLLCNVVAFGVPITSLFLERRMEIDKNNPFKTNFITTIFLKSCKI